MGNDSERGLMARLASVRSRLPTKWKRTLQYVRVKHHMKHVHGPAKLELGDDEAVVTCLVKNGSFYLPRFVDHYRQLGFRHIFFLDNGSTDTSVEEMASYDDVSVYRCDLPIGDHQTLMKRALARTVAPHGWCLDVDIDEFFDYPNRDALDLGGFLRYLNSRDFTLVVAQMLDMFADGPISDLAQAGATWTSVDQYPYYDLSAVTRTDYSSSELAIQRGSNNVLANPATELFFGGIRKTLFDLDCLLTKHPLFRVDGNLELFTHPHFSDHGRVADVSCVLRHYKLVSNCFETSAMNRDAFPATRRGYEDLLELIEKASDFNIKSDSAIRYEGTDELLAAKFLFASPDYVGWTGADRDD